MSGETWSCFQQLPAEFVDAQAVLTLKWLRPRPTPAGFGLTPSELNETLYRRAEAIQRWAVLALAPFVAIAAVLFLFVDQGLIIDRDNERLAAVAASALTALVIIATALWIMRFRRAEPRRDALRGAILEFEQLDAWRAQRCEPKFWTRLDGAGFKREVAELMAGVFGTGQVALTYSAQGYGADILACAAGGRIIALCKAAAGKVSAEEVRALAGAKSYFAAQQAILASYDGPSQGAEDSNRVAERLHISFWNAEALAGWAMRLRGGVEE